MRGRGRPRLRGSARGGLGWHQAGPWLGRRLDQLEAWRRREGQRGGKQEQRGRREKKRRRAGGCARLRPGEAGGGGGLGRGRARTSIHRQPQLCSCTYCNFSEVIFRPKTTKAHQTVRSGGLYADVQWENRFEREGSRKNLSDWSLCPGGCEVNEFSKLPISA